MFDVRTPAEYREAHAKLARSMPLDSLDLERIYALCSVADDQQICIICRPGYRSLIACAKFQQAGFTNVVNVEGGTSAWESAGLPVIRDRSGVSLASQVWIAAGFLIMVGTYPGNFVHPSFLAVPAVAELALLVTAIRDDDSLEVVMAKMPWNDERPK